MILANIRLIFLQLIFCFLFIAPASAQVNAVEFGKNRIQYKKFDWHFYQSENYNVYYNEGGLELAKYLVQLAEEELNYIEDEMEYPLSKRADVIIYNHYDDYKSSNIGLGTDWQNSGGLTRLVNNKMALYFDGNHNTLRIRVRQGIARILMENILFGDDIGEFASNQALLDLPTWLTDGYVSYIAQHWSSAKDEDLKNAILSGNYKNFNQLAFEKPELAGHSFWYYIARKYKEKNVTYFLYLSRIYKNLNSAAERICKKKFNDVLDDFMNEEGERYLNDIKQRRNVPKGRLSVVEELYKSDFYHFAANPNPRNNAYAVVEFTRGKYRVKFLDNVYDEKTLLEYGARTRQGDMNPNTPILAWDGKGSRLLCIYTLKGKTYMFVYDMIAGIKRFKQEITGFDQILDAGYLTDANTLVISAVKNGHSDIYTYRIDNGKTTAITNDVYDDLDPTFVTFPGRYGIIFSSNRPIAKAPPNSDTVLPSRNRFNIFLADYDNKEYRQITRLTNMKYGEARYPMQYSVNHFTFVSDENGIGNRWAGFFSSQTGGLDTLFIIGDEILRNPDKATLDSTLDAWQKPGPDSIAFFKTYEDSTYTFPITNYQSSLLETRVAGNNDQVSEVRQEGDYKFLYKLRIDSLALRKRNVNARPTDYIRNMIVAEKMAGGQRLDVIIEAPESEDNDFFQNEFAADSSVAVTPKPATDELSPLKELYSPDNALSKASLHPYKYKFDVDNVLAGLTNSIIINKYQPYANGSLPIVLNNGNLLNLSGAATVSDVMEDIKLIAGYRTGFSFSDNDVFLSFQNQRRFIDWGITYYRSKVNNFSGFFKPQDTRFSYNNVMVSNLYQFNINYPIDEIKSVRLIGGLRRDKGVIRPFSFFNGPDTIGLKFADSVANTAIGRVEFVYDNTLLKADNIWDGLRFKVYTEMYLPTERGASIKGNKVFITGFDARYYYPIYKNFTWCVRAAGDLSYGDAYMMYYLGGVDGWLDPKANSEPQPSTKFNYLYQTVAVNMRGYNQNLANGHNAVVINSELRLPVFTTFIKKPINNAFIRNFQLVQFIDLGTAWNGGPNKIARPTQFFSPFTVLNPQTGEIGPDPTNPTVIKLKPGGIGPFAGGYGFGVRSTLIGYFVKLDAAWPMARFFQGKPILYLALGFDF